MKEYKAKTLSEAAQAAKRDGSNDFIWNGKVYSGAKTGSPSYVRDAHDTTVAKTSNGGAANKTQPVTYNRATNAPALAQKSKFSQDYFDPKSYEAMAKGESKTDTGLGIGVDELKGVASYIPDAIKLGIGLTGATEKLPEYKIPSEFMDYKQRLREMSTQGLTAAELATGQRQAERGYAYDYNAIENFAGGRPGVALANLGRAASTLQDAYGNINLADAQMRRQNMSNYGGVLNQYLNMDQNIFNTKYNEAYQSKMAGANLAADALSNIENRMDYNKSYGAGSIYGQYMNQLGQGQKMQNEIYQYMLAHPTDLSLQQYLPQALPSNVNAPNAIDPNNYLNVDPYSK